MIPRDYLSARVHLFRALADPTRLQILEMLHVRGQRTVTEIFEALKKPQNLTSHHLACLRNCGLVETERMGKNIYYSLAGKQIIDLLEQSDEHARALVDRILACEIVRDRDKKGPATGRSGRRARSRIR